MDTAEGERPDPVIEPDRVLATYRHVRKRWGLNSDDAARMKAKRAGWAPLPKNNPADVTRLVVPREQWDAAEERSLGTPFVPEEHVQGNTKGTVPRTAQALADAAAKLAALISRLEERDAAELREARALTDRQAAELAELRERVGRSEAERDHARTERERAELATREARAELASWTAGGPFARALRAFLWRR